jgi:hypothetical protein
LTDDLLMTQMHSVKKSNRQADFAPPSFKLLRAVDDLHARHGRSHGHQFQKRHHALLQFVFA